MWQSCFDEKDSTSPLGLFLWDIKVRIGQEFESVNKKERWLWCQSFERANSSSVTILMIVQDRSILYMPLLNCPMHRLSRWDFMWSVIENVAITPVNTATRRKTTIVSHSNYVHTIALCLLWRATNYKALEESPLTHNRLHYTLRCWNKQELRKEH